MAVKLKQHKIFHNFHNFPVSVTSPGHITIAAPVSVTSSGHATLAAPVSVTFPGEVTETGAARIQEVQLKSESNYTTLNGLNMNRALFRPKLSTGPPLFTEILTFKDFF